MVEWLATLALLLESRVRILAKTVDIYLFEIESFKYSSTENLFHEQFTGTVYRIVFSKIGEEKLIIPMTTLQRLVNWIQSNIKQSFIKFYKTHSFDCCETVCELVHDLQYLFTVTHITVVVTRSSRHLLQLFPLPPIPFDGNSKTVCLGLCYFTVQLKKKTITW